MPKKGTTRTASTYKGKKSAPKKKYTKTVKKRY